MKKNNLLFILLLFSILSFSCEDIFEEDISSNVVNIIFPKQGDEIIGNSVDFNWSQMEGATEYQVQIYDDNDRLIIDTITENNTLNIILQPKFYYWRIKASNFSYETDFTSNIDFSVIESIDLSQQTVILNTPSNHIYLNNVTNLLLTWENNDAVSSYNLVINKELNGITTILQIGNIINNFYQPDSSIFNNDAIYHWKVQGVNNVSETPFSEYIFYLDTAIPNPPVLIQPIDNAVLSNTTVNFYWEPLQDFGNIQAPLNYILEISDNPNFINLIFTDNISETNFTYNFSTTGIYYWRIKAIDQAGNIGDYSNVFSLKLE